MGTDARDWVQSRLKALNKTYDDLAQAIGKDRSVASKVVSGKLHFRPEYAAPFAEVLAVPPLQVLQHLAPGVALDDARWYGSGGDVPLDPGHAVMALARRLNEAVLAAVEAGMTVELAVSAGGPCPQLTGRVSRVDEF